MSQLSRRIIMLPRTGATYDPDAVAYFAAMTVQPDAIRKGLINTLIVNAKANGYWGLLDWLVLIAAHDAQAGRLNARNPTKLLSAANTPTFTTDRGYQGDGTASYLDFGELFNAAGNQYAQDSANIGAWCNLQGAGTATVNHVGVTGGTGRATIRASGSTSNETTQVNDASNDITRAGTSDRRGHRTNVRTGSTAKKSYFSGSVVATFTTASSALPATNGAALRNSTTYAPDRMAAVYSGAGLTDAQVASLHSDLNTYLTAIGGN